MGVILASTPSLVMPVSLSISYARVRSYLIASNEYSCGESQRRLDSGTSRNRWQISKRLTDAQLATFRTHYDTVKGSLTSFYFYDPWETSPMFTMTPSGTTGRYIVTFDFSLVSSRDLSRNVIQGIQLVEVA